MPEAQKPPSFTYAEQPLLTETFADSLHTMVWDGQTLRIEFCVTRYPDLDSGDPDPRAARYPVSRMVLTAAAAADLHNRLRQTMEALTKAGVFRNNNAPAQAPSENGAAQLGLAPSSEGENGSAPENLSQPRNGLI